MREGIFLSTQKGMNRLMEGFCGEIQRDVFKKNDLFF